MTVKPYRPGGRRPGGQRPSGAEPATKQSVGRPKGEPSTIVNVRLPLTLVAQLDRYLAGRWSRPHGQTGAPRRHGFAGQ